jgi:FMN phosphatase YigB (HAD superfamily)
MQVVVRGDNRLHPFSESFDRAEQIKDLTYAPGYFVKTPTIQNDHKYSLSKPVLVSIGGWYETDAVQFYTISLKSRKFSGKLSRNPWIVFMPGSTPEEDFEEMQRLAKTEAADGGITVVRNSQEFKKFLPSALLSLNKASYNTCMEAISYGTPLVVVPFDRAEHIIRARGLEREGVAGVASIPGTRPLVDSVCGSANSPAEWGQLIDDIYSRRGMLREHRIQLDGAEKFAKKIVDDVIPTSKTTSVYRPVVKRRSLASLPLIDALIFDWDDTLVDLGSAVDMSFDYAIDSMVRRGNRKVYDWTIANKRNRTAPYSPPEFFCQMFGSTAVGQEAYALQMQCFHELISEGAVRIKDGVPEVLDYCRECGLPMAIASNSPQIVLELGRKALLGPGFQDLIMIGTDCNIPSKQESQILEMALSRMKEKYDVSLGVLESIYSIGDSYEKDGYPSIKLGFTFIRFGSIAASLDRLEDLNTAATLSSHSELLRFIYSHSRTKDKCNVHQAS